VYNRRKRFIEAATDLMRDGQVRDRSELQRATSFLRGLLAEGPRTVETVKAEAEAAGIAWTTLRRAKIALGIQAKKPGFSTGWIWTISSR
jgi:putative DNA primase/helicase